MDYIERIAPNFNLSEFTATSYNLDNRIPSDKIYMNIVFGVQHVLQPVRDKFKKPIIITSGYRCPKLNTLVGGVKKSAHMQGRAADIRIRHLPHKERMRLFYLLLMNKYTTQVLWEKKGSAVWLHVSWHEFME